MRLTALRRRRRELGPATFRRGKDRFGGICPFHPGGTLYASGEEKRSAKVVIGKLAGGLLPE